MTEMAPWVQSDDESAISYIMDSYGHALATCDGATLKALFHPTAQMYSRVGSTDVFVPIEEMIAHIAAQDPDWNKAGDYSWSIDRLEVTGSIASVRLVELGYLGRDFDDHFILVKTGGVWMIVTKAYQIRRPAS